MGRPRKPKGLSRTTWIQVRCTPAWKDWLVGLAKDGGYPDVAAMIEAMANREGKRLKRPPAPPR